MRKKYLARGVGAGPIFFCTENARNYIMSSNSETSEFTHNARINQCVMLSAVILFLLGTGIAGMLYALTIGADTAPYFWIAPALIIGFAFVVLVTMIYLRAQ